MNRRHLIRVAPLVLVSTALPSDRAVAEGIDEFRWPLDGSNTWVNKGVDHDTTVCGEDTAVADCTLDRFCGTDKTYDNHGGNDLFTSDDISIYAAAPGVVISAIDAYGRGFWQSTAGHGFGNSVVIYHGDGLATLYAHMGHGTVTVSPGQFVDCGDKLGIVGSSGNSTANHLHFEVRNGVNVSRSGPLGGFFTLRAKIDPFSSSEDEDGMQCGSAQTMFSDESGGSDGMPSRACDTDEDATYSGDSCYSNSQELEVLDGDCVQDSDCNWAKCVDGKWFYLYSVDPEPDEGTPPYDPVKPKPPTLPTPDPDGAMTAAIVCEAENYAFESCEAPSCDDLTDESSCTWWSGACSWCKGTCVGADVGCEPPVVECGELDGMADACGQLDGCVYHECAQACVEESVSPCAAGCVEECGSGQCVSGALNYYNSNNCISGPATGTAQLTRWVNGEPIPEGLIEFGAGGSFCADLEGGAYYSITQSDLPSVGCAYNVQCTVSFEPAAAGGPASCGSPDSCEDLGNIEFDCGS